MSAPVARSVLALLRDRRFGRYFAANLISNVGTWCHDIAAVVFVYQVTGASLMVALVPLASAGVSIVLAPIGGQLADRFDRRILLIATGATMAVVAAVLTVLMAVLEGATLVPVILLATIFLGVGRAIGTPAQQALLPALVPTVDLAQAAALQSLTFNLARALGPALGTVLIAFGGPAIAFGANAVSFIVFTLVLTSIRTSSPPGHAADRRFLAGLSYVRRNPALGVLLLVGLLVGMATDPVVTLGPSLADGLGLGQERAGWLVTAFGTGAFVMAPFVGHLRLRVGAGWSGIVGLCMVCVGFVGSGCVDSTPAVLGFLVVAGMGYLAASSDVSASLLERLHDGYRGRVMALWTMGFIGGRPLAAVIDGAVADLVSPTVALLTNAGILFVGCVAFATWMWRSADGLDSQRIRV